MHTSHGWHAQTAFAAAKKHERLSLAAQSRIPLAHAVEQRTPLAHAVAQPRGTRSAPYAQVAKMAKTVLALALGSAAAFSPNAAPRATTIVRSDPNIKTDVGSGWKPESGGFSSTDTPDFFYDDDDERVTKQRPSINDTSHNTL